MDAHSYRQKNIYIHRFSFVDICYKKDRECVIFLQQVFTFVSSFYFYVFYLPNSEVAPQLIYKFIEQTMQPGPSVSLKCSASGNPTPKIVWQLDGFALPNVSYIYTYNSFQSKLFHIPIIHSFIYIFYTTHICYIHIFTHSSIVYTFKIPIHMYVNCNI